MAMKRLYSVKDDLSDSNKMAAEDLLRFLRENNDGILQGAWFPDSIIHDNSTGHIWQLKKENGTGTRVHKIPSTSKVKQLVEHRSEQEAIAKIKGALPDRCQALAYEIRDKLKIKNKVGMEQNNPGAAIIPNNNEIALSFFMLSHYVADGHMPLHCDARQFPDSIHDYMEKYWEDEIKSDYLLIEDPARDDFRFGLDQDGFPVENILGTLLTEVNDDIEHRRFVMSFGSDNDNVWDYMVDVCYHSYLLSTEIIPHDVTASLTREDYISQYHQKFKDSSAAILGDTIDSMARIWLNVWKEYEEIQR